MSTALDAELRSDPTAFEAESRHRRSLSERIACSLLTFLAIQEYTKLFITTFRHFCQATNCPPCR